MNTVAPPHPTVDPRLRARRVAVAREAGRRRLHRLVALGSALAFVLLVAGVARSPLLAVNHIEITGPQHTTEAVLDAAIGSIRGKPIYSVDTGAIRERLEALPWVASASVTRHWPRTISIHLTEREPRAVAIGRDGSYRLVATDGHVLASTLQLPPDMVELVGPEPAGGPGTVMDAATQGALAVVAALPPSLVGKVSTVEWAVDGEVRLGLAPRGRVLFGPATAIAQKLLALDTMLRVVKPVEVGEIDVRAPDAPILHQADVSKLPAGAGTADALTAGEGTPGSGP